MITTTRVFSVIVKPMDRFRALPAARSSSVELKSIERETDHGTLGEPKSGQIWLKFWFGQKCLLIKYGGKYSFSPRGFRFCLPWKWLYEYICLRIFMVGLTTGNIVQFCSNKLSANIHLTLFNFLKYLCNKYLRLESRPAAAALRQNGNVQVAVRRKRMSYILLSYS